ncbi:MAG TPA: class I SAM-dependent methyltransferase [Candidatus Elarobacter sp.]
MWSIPEDDLRVLGDVRDKDVLELGCGGAQWSIALAQRGARVVALDNSARQLDHARRLMAEAGVDFPLLHASAENVPLPDASFDVVFCDHGAMTYADPDRTVPEAARLLRSGGLFAFNAESTLHAMCWDPETDTVGETLRHGYHDVMRIDDGESVSFTRPYGAWIRLFRANGFAVEDLIELQAPPGATTTYEPFAGDAWARRWPVEQIWRVRRS